MRFITLLALSIPCHTTLFCHICVSSGLPMVFAIIEDTRDTVSLIKHDKHIIIFHLSPICRIPSASRACSSAEKSVTPQFFFLNEPFNCIFTLFIVIGHLYFSIGHSEKSSCRRGLKFASCFPRKVWKTR